MEPAQLIQIVGSALILVAFILQQTKRISSDSSIYLWVNVIGSAILLTSALMGSQWGFVVLEVVWGLVSLDGLVNKGRSKHRKKSRKR